MEARIEKLGDDDVIAIEDGSNTSIVPLDAVASWSELLGYDDPADALDAILRVQSVGEPAPCPATGRNAWTDAYDALEVVQSVATQEAELAASQGKADDPRSPELRAMLAVAPAASQVDSIRSAARAALGVTEPPGRALSITNALSPKAVASMTPVRSGGPARRATQSALFGAAPIALVDEPTPEPVDGEPLSSLDDLKGKLRADLGTSITARRVRFRASLAPAPKGELTNGS